MTCLNDFCQAEFAQNLNTWISGFCIKSYILMPYQRAIELNMSKLSKHILNGCYLHYKCRDLYVVNCDRCYGGNFFGLFNFVDRFQIGFIFCYDISYLAPF